MRIELPWSLVSDYSFGLIVGPNAPNESSLRGDSSVDERWVIF